MMQQDKRLYAVIIAVALLAIVLSTCLGAVAGGIVGYWAAQRTGRSIREEYLRTLQEWRREHIVPEQPWPFPPERLPFKPQAGGALVTKVVEDSPADRAGIRAGDLITTVNGERIDEEDTLKSAIRVHRPGDRVEIVLGRENSQRTVTVRLGEHPEEKDVAYLGVFYEMIPMVVEPPTID